jgi:putative SOS response-associated peptidase YedK
MCAAYTIQGPVKNFEIPSGFSIKNLLPYSDIENRVLPYRLAPVLVREDSEIILMEMSFSLVPSWSKEKKVRFATHNARIETVLEKPTWKKPFLSQRALIPISYFVEPIYENQFAGHMVQFFPKSQTTLFAAGIYDEWTDRTSGEILSSFSILTTEPPNFIATTGHDRCPIFLKPSAFEEWLEPGKKDGEGLLKLLSSHQHDIDFDARIDRPMKPGWEKRK